MVTFLKDTNKWVKTSAYSNLGHFIHCLKGGKISDNLLTEFCRMPDNDINTLTKNNDIIYSCAYNLPAVLDAIGKDSWESKLWKAY